MMTKGSKLFKTMLFTSLAVMMLALGGCGGKKEAASAAGGADKKVTLKMATQLPASHPLVKAMDTFKKKVADKTKGSVTIQIYPAGQLFNDKTMNDALMSGGIDLGLNTVGRWASIIPAMDVFDVPFLFPTYESVSTAIDKGLGDKLGGQLEKKGVRPLIWADYGFVEVANDKKEIKKPADFAGLKIRGYSKYSTETIKALGASSVTMGSGEVYMAIQRGTIDGQISGPSAMRDRKMYEVHKYMTVTNHASPEFILAMNDKSFAKLSDSQKKAITEAAKETQTEIRTNAKKADLEAMKTLKEKGMTLYEIPAAEIPEWQKATKSVWDLFIKENGKIGQELIDICTKK